MNKYLDNNVFVELRKTIDDLISKKINMLHKRFGTITGEMEIAIEFLEKLKSYDYSTKEIDSLLFSEYDYCELWLDHFGLQVLFHYGDEEKTFEFGADDEFIRKCIEDPKYVYKIDEIFAFVENFLSRIKGDFIGGDRWES